MFADLHSFGYIQHMFLFWAVSDFSGKKKKLGEKERMGKKVKSEGGLQ
jgi:hypothetical protein